MRPDIRDDCMSHAAKSGNGFVAFLKERGIPKGVLPCYWGNRLHILFHISRKLMRVLFPSRGVEYPVAV